MAQQTFEEIVAAVKQAESRGKRYAADGKTLTTSPKGALGEMQVMPKTITDPGFGVAPAKDKSPDEIARVGVDYLQAMKQKYGDTEKALIAYNWGPGSTDKWIAAGADPKKLPAETRTYVERVKGFLGKDVPRETMAKKDREPLPASLPPMAEATPAKATVAMAASTASGKNLPDIKAMPASYQAAFALAALADAQDEEDDRVYNENKSTETEEFFANYKPVNKLASLDLSVTPVMMKDGGEVDAEDLTKPFFGNPNIRKQGEAARRLAAMRDVNTFPDPKTYAAVAGALGTRPDQMGFSVLNPKYKEIMDVANPAFYAGTALQIAPVAQGPGMGRMVGAAERALEPAVRRTLEGGGKAAQMLQDLAAPPSQMFVRARPEAAARHADLQAKGLSPEEIRAQNLTLVDNRGNLIEEISDAPAVLQQKTASVPRMYYDMLKHPELQSIYPAYDMPDVRIGTTRRKDAPLASASFGEKEGIQGTVRSLPGDDVRGTVRGTLLHEGQHAIQSMEGFTEGANPSSFVAYIKAKRGIYDADPTVNENVIREMERVYPNLPDVTDRIGQDLKTRYGKVFPSDKRMGEALYRHMPGEVQAELARVRSNLTPDELKATPLEVSMQQLNINPANILEMNKMGSRLDRQIGDLEYDVYGYAQGGPVYRAEGSPKEGERKLDRETMDMLRRQGTSPASLQRVAPPADISSSAAGLPKLMLFADPRIDQTNAYGYVLEGGDDTKNRAMAQAMFLNKSRSEDYPDTIAHETEHLLARQNLGSAANINSKFDELIGNKGTSRLNFVRDAVKAAPYLKEKYDLQSSYLDPKMFEFQTKFGLGKNLLYEQLASLAALEQRHKIDLTKDPELRKTLFARPDVRETYNALTGLRQTRLDPRDLPPHTRVPEPGMLDAIKGVFKRADGGMVYRADGSPETGEQLTPQQIERIAAQESAEREAASNAAFIAQKSGIGRKAGPVSQALQSGQGQIEFLKGMTNVPQNILGAPMDISNMIANVYGGGAEKPFMGSEYIKEGLRAKGLGFTPSTDPTLAGFYGAGDLSSNLVNPAGVTRTGVKAAEKTGEAAKMLAQDFQQYNQNLAVPGASYVRRPAGGVFPTAKSIEEEPISSLDKSIKSTLDNNLSYVRAPDENKEAAKQFMDTKLRDYFKTKASSVSDPLREALINGRIKIPKDTPLEEEFPQALINASRAGDVTAMREIENRFDKMMNVTNYRLKPAGTGAATDREAAEAFKQTILQQMKANPSIIPDEFLLRLAKKDTSKLSKQEQAAEVAGIRQKLADNPTLFNTVIEPKMTRLLGDRLVENVNPDSLTQFADLYPTLVNAPKRQEGIMALQADVPITDVNYMGIPEIFGIGKSDLIEELTKINPKDLAQMSVPEFYAKAIPSVAKKEAFREKVRTVDKLAAAGKPVPAELGQFGTKEFLPTDSSGMTWREITDPQASLIQAKFLGNSIGGYAEAGTYGPMDNGINALKNGEVRLFSLYDKNGHAVNNVEFVTPKVSNKLPHKANTITQMNGNGVKTGNVVPEQYAEQMLDLVNALNPKDIPLSIKQLFQDKGLIVAPPPEPLNAARTIQMNMFQPPAQRATGGMIERQPNDNRRYL